MAQHTSYVYLKELEELPGGAITMDIHSQPAAWAVTVSTLRPVQGNVTMALPLLLLSLPLPLSERFETPFLFSDHETALCYHGQRRGKGSAGPLEQAV